MKNIKTLSCAIAPWLAGVAAIALAGAAAAQEAAGIAHPWQLGMQAPATEIYSDIQHFHNWFLLPIMFGIVAFVGGLLAYIMLRFNEKANPTPAKFSHNTTIEVIWTAIPVLILLALVVPSITALYKYNTVPENTDLTVKAIGNQWFWSYEYPDYEGLAFDSYMLEQDQLTNPEWRNLETDNYLVLPTNTNIRMQFTARSVIHAFAVPAFGMKKDAIPGRINELPLNIQKEGIYFGQCSEICGVGHAYMPITVKAVSPAEFKAWVQKAQLAAANGDVIPKPALTQPEIQTALLVSSQ